MYKSLVALAILSVASTPVVAQTAPATTPAATPDKPQTVKKRVCYQEEADSYSRLGGRKVCKMVDVPAQPSGGQHSAQTPTPSTPNERG